MVHHPKDKTDLSTQLAIELNVNTSRLVSEVFPNVPVYVAIGNHDFYPVNDLPTQENSIYDGIADGMKQWFQGDATQESLFRKGQ